MTARDLFLPSTLIWLAPFAVAVAADDLFRQQVEPILRQRCYGCHSHQDEVMEGGLTLDWRSGWETGGARGPAIVPGKPDQSLLIRAVRHTEPELQMPEQRLPATEIAILERWVAEGASDPRTVRPGVAADSAAARDWWSLRPLTRPAVPRIGRGDLDNPIDAFLAAHWPSDLGEPAAEADRRTLLRRLCFDLHGLPPTWEQLQEFLHDKRPDAYSRLVDRLLADPAYGERWARHWLDTVHFADSHGFEHDVFRPHAYPYRDYVVSRLNDDIPWPQFIREQLAVDVFAPAAPQWLPALGFLGAGPYDHSAAVTAPKSFEYLDRDDLVTQVMAAFNSTTANCARCHSHKFDPISQADYFALQAVFAGIGKGNIPFDRDSTAAAARRRWQTVAAAAAARQQEILLADEYQTMVQAWEAARPPGPVWQPWPVDTFVSTHGATLQRLPDGSILSAGSRPEKETVVLAGPAPAMGATALTALRLELLTHDSLPMRGPGRADNGNLHLNEVEIRRLGLGADQSEPIAIARAVADFDQVNWTVAHAIDGKLETAWGIHPAIGSDHQAIFELSVPLPAVAGQRLQVVLKQQHGGAHVIGRFRLSWTDAAQPAQQLLPADATAALAVPTLERTQEQRLALAAAVLRIRAEQELAKLPAQEKVYAAAAEAENERGVVRLPQPREIRVLKRGDLEQPGAVAEPGALVVFADLPGRFALPAGASESARRAALADWLVDERNPLTWRSIANRLWHFHFGQGLCRTPSDFGRMGDTPSQPQLLDWLACELRDSGGALKPVHRLICTSQTYRRSAEHRSDALPRDPDNRLLARGVRQRLDADGFRDAVLQVCGRADRTMGGPPQAHFTSKPGPQMTPVLDYNAFDWDSPGATRRSIYRVVWRGIADPLFEALDFPDLGLLAPSRGFSASPLQALALLNNRFVLHHARHAARRAEQQEGDRAGQIRWLVRQTWLREPTASELAALHALAERHGVAAAARLLFNSNEFLFVD